MYRGQYAEIVADDQQDARQREFQAFSKVVAALEQASQSGSQTQTMEALGLVDDLWAILLQDLSHDDNALPHDLRARLISVGLWITRRSLDLRLSAGGDLRSLIDINAMVRDGLRR